MLLGYGKVCRQAELADENKIKFNILQLSLDMFAHRGWAEKRHYELENSIEFERFADYLLELVEKYAEEENNK